MDAVYNGASQVMLYVAGIGGTGIIIASVAKAYFRRLRIQASLNSM